MTKEEILQHIKSELANENTEIYLDVNDYETIVKALDQEPCEDAISRQAAIDALENTKEVAR